MLNLQTRDQTALLVSAIQMSENMGKAMYEEELKLTPEKDQEAIEFLEEMKLAAPLVASIAGTDLQVKIGGSPNNEERTNYLLCMYEAPEYNHSAHMFIQKDEMKRDKAPLVTALLIGLILCEKQRKETQLGCT